MRAGELSARTRRLKLGAVTALLVAEVLVALAVLLLVLG